MFSQSKSASSSHTGVALPRPLGEPHVRIVTGGLAVVASLIGTQLVAPVEASAAGAAQSGLHQDGTSGVKLSGAWTSHTSDKAIGGSYANLNDKGEAQINFKSTGIAWIGRRNAFGGIAAVYLDGKKAKTVDLYSATTKYEQVIYTITGLKNTTHTLKIVRTGTKNAKSNGGNLIVDAFNVLDTVAPPAPAGVTATAERSGARIIWKASPAPTSPATRSSASRAAPHFDRHHHRRPDQLPRHRPGHRHQLPLHRHCERHQHQHLHPVGQRHRAERESCRRRDPPLRELPDPDHHRDQPG